MRAQNHFLNNRALWTASELTMGRLMRAPDDHPGAPTGFTPNGGGSGNQGQDQNNQGVNNDTSSGDSNNQNNSGDDDFDPASFWTDDDDDDAPPSKTDSAGKPDSPSSTDSNQDGNIGKVLMDEIEKSEFGELFTKDIAEKINEGDFTGANEAMTQNLRKAMKQSLVHSAKLLREYGKVMTSEVQRMIEERITGQVNTDYLTQQIPSASNPKIGPAVRAIYDQALRRSKGDKVKAVKMTKSMMNTLANESADDLGIDVAPRDPHSSSRSTPKTDWVEELTAR